MPLISGIIRSQRMRSQAAPVSRWARAARPPSARTTSCLPRFSARRATKRMSASSSTTRMRAMENPSGGEEVEEGLPHERLLEEAVCAAAACLDAKLFVVRGAHHVHARGAVAHVGGEAAEKLDAAHAGHEDVEDDE